MADKDTLWTNVKAAYATDLLLPLTNIHDATAIAIDDAVGTAAAQQAIDYFVMYAETTFVITTSTHNAVGIRATIAVLLERGGVSSALAREEWDEVFGDTGLLSKVKKTGARGRQAFTTNSNMTQASGLTSSGKRRKPWGDVESLPVNYMPRSSEA